jgi:CheY-like chemotaxis protein
LAKDGLDAIMCEEQDPPVDLLVTDLRMPRLDGCGLIRQLRIKYADLPVVVTSGYVSPEIAYELETRINRRIRILRKPIDPADLRASVHALLGSVDIHRVAKTMPPRWIIAAKLVSVLS